MKSIILLFTVLSSAAAVAAAGGGSTVGPANPAAVFCEEIGGIYEVVDSIGAGPTGMCDIGQWALYREMDRLNCLTAVEDPSERNDALMANPAAVNCLALEGELISNGDGSTNCLVSGWVLFRQCNQPTME